MLALTLATLLRACSATWRKTLVESQLEARLAEARAEGRASVMVAFWHGDVLPLFTLLRRTPGCIVTNRSRRGRLIARMGTLFGHRTVQIPESGGEALAALGAVLEREPLAGVAVDGPCGPYHAVKLGVIQVASELGLTIQPVSSHARWKLVLPRWDRMKVPLPFTRIALVLGPVLRVPSGLNQEGVHLWSEHLARALEDLDRRARSELSGKR